MSDLSAFKADIPQSDTMTLWEKAQTNSVSGATIGSDERGPYINWGDNQKAYYTGNDFAVDKDNNLVGLGDFKGITIDSNDNVTEFPSDTNNIENVSIKTDRVTIDSNDTVRKNPLDTTNTTVTTIGDNNIDGATPPQPGYGTDNVDANNEYIVQKGDTLSEIAHKNNKAGGQFMSVEALALLNGIENPNMINTGEELTLTVNPEVVSASIEKIKSMLLSVKALQNQIHNLADFGTTDSGELDQIAGGIISDIKVSTTTIIENAELYQKWLSDLLTALSDTELYATNVIDSNTMFKVSNIE